MAVQDSMSFSGIEESDIISQLTIMRAEKGRQNLRVDSFASVMNVFDMPVDGFYCPCVEGYTKEDMALYSAVKHCSMYALEDRDICNKGVSFLNKMKSSSVYAQGIGRQRLISKEAVFLEALGKAPNEIMKLIYEGLEITYPEIVNATYDRDMLLFEEAPLLHRLARVHMIKGEATQAKTLIKNILTGLLILPQDDRNKERMLAPILLSLAQCYVKEGDYIEALKVCDAGHKIAIKRSNSFYTPDFTELRAYCLAQLGQKEELPELLLQAYAGYNLLRRHNKADSLLKYAKDNSISINTHGMETIRPAMPEPVFAHGESIKCDNVGGFIAGLRHEANLSQEALGRDLCTKSTIHKLENKAIPLDKVYLLEAIMQRLGRHIDYYFETFIPEEVFKDKQMRDEISSLLINRKYKEAEGLLEKLAARKKFTDNNINMQFVEAARARLYGRKNKSSPEHMDMLKKALSITLKDFDIRDTARTRLTNREIIILNQIANRLCLSGVTHDMREGLRLYQDIIESMDIYYVDEREKMRMYVALLTNYSTFLGRSKRYEESIEFAVKGEELDAKHSRLHTMPDLVNNRACCMLELGDKEKCLPYFALAYYGSRLIGRRSDADITKKYVMERLGANLFHHPPEEAD